MAKRIRNQQLRTNWSWYTDFGNDCYPDLILEGKLDKDDGCVLALTDAGTPIAGLKGQKLWRLAKAIVRRFEAGGEATYKAPEVTSEIVAAPFVTVNDIILDNSDRVEKLAYALYEARGYQNGNAEQDWLKAEELLS